MASTNVELYEALKKTMAPDAARMLVEALSGRDVARKTDVEELRAASTADIRELRVWAEQRFAKLDERLAGIQEQLARQREAFMKWILAFFVPLWVTMFVAIVTGLLRA